MATTFPTLPVAKASIPVWLNIAAIRYPRIKKSINRTGGLQEFYGKSYYRCSVPAPSIITDMNSVNYTNDPISIVQMITGGNKQTKADAIRTMGIAQLLNNENEIVRKDGDSGPSNKSNLYLRPDMMDTMFLGNAPKAYEYEVKLVCTSAADAAAASEICTVLSTACWPTMKAGGNGSGTTMLVPPDVFIVWISKKVALRIETNTSWISGVGPSLCILDKCMIQKGFGSDGRILSSKNGDPLVYGISLRFVEIEPTFQISPGFGTQNRSSALSSSNTTASTGPA